MYLLVFVETIIDLEGLKQLICDNRNPYSVLFLLKLKGNWNVLIADSGSLTCADPERFVRGGPTFTTFVFFSLMREGTIKLPL